MNPIYLDNNATTPVLPEVIRAMNEYDSLHFANPSSQHLLGRAARKQLNICRQKIAETLGARHDGMNPDRVIFTSGATESNNLAVLGLAGSRPGRILISAIEHPSLVMLVDPLRRLGHDVELIRVDSNGVCDLDHLRSLFDEPVLMVAVMLGNNETGVIQPVDDIAKLCQEHSAHFHCDVVQAVGKSDVSFSKLDCDSISLTAHKFHGPKGIGVLVTKPAVKILPTTFGGFQQEGIRPGTESVSPAVGLCAALDHWKEFDPKRENRLSELRDRLESLLLDSLGDIHIHGRDVPRLPHTSNISFLGVNRQSFIMAADMAGLAVSTGSACSSGSSEPSHVLLATGAKLEQIESSIRLSLGGMTTIDEIDLAASRIIKIYNDLRK